MKKILIICPYPENVAPGQRLKYEQYFTSWRNNNYSLVLSPFMSMRFWNIVYSNGRIIEKILWTTWGYIKRIFDLLRLPFFDGVYVHLWVTPFGPPIFEWLIKIFNKKIIYDIDDMIFLGHKSAANHFIAVIKGKTKMITLMKKANHVIVCTPKLYEFVNKYNDKLTDISSTINTDVYMPNKSYSKDKILTIGWSGSHSTSKYFLLLENVLKKLKEQVNFKILVIGDTKIKINGLEVEAIQWNEKTEVQDLSRIDIGLYPLPYEEWVYGKSGLKALQYMALEIPTVATAIGANFRIIDHNVSGMLVKTEKEWEEAILFLIQNSDIREKFGKKGREVVEKNYSVKSNEKIYLNILNSVYN